MKSHNECIMTNKAIVFAAAAISAASVFADVSLPHVFGDNMVLQRGQKVPVWGKAAPGERVAVSFAGQVATTVADADGKWRLDLAPLKASSEGAEFRVAGANTIVFSNVVVGEVWFCSGQSNMEFPMGGLPWDATRRIKDSEREIAAANHPLLRHFKVSKKTSETPLDDVDAAWELTTSASVARQSAVAYIFGETLMKELNVPVGLINSSWGGTRIEPWTPAAHPDDLWLLQHIKEFKRSYDRPTELWNGMVAGLVPYAIKGAIWYQGEANRHDGDAYIEKTVSLVRGWRREWGQGDFPYFLVQLAPYKYDSPTGTVLAVFQEAQARIPERVPNSGYTVINDVGNVKDIHPTDKRTVGMRLADQALDRVYGKFVRPWRTPVPKSARVDGSELRVTFENADGLKTRDGKAPTDFELRGATGAWKPATARIDGCDVVLTAEGLAEPAAVRFAPYNGSTPNLVNGAGLPTGPFRREVTHRTDLLYMSHVHRGGGKFERPDNTLETFKWCWENGSALECDCRRTKDGVGIMLHDKTLKRTAHGISPEMAAKNVSDELAWNEIKDLDVGSYLKELNPKSGNFCHHRIPTIEATFAAMKGHPTYLCFVDEKGAGPEYIAKKAVEAGVQDQVYYTGQDYQKALDWTKVLPNGKTLIWIGTWPVPKPEHNAEDIARFEAHFEKKMDEMRANGFKGVSAVSLHSYYNPDAAEPFVPRESYLRKIIDEFHAHNIPVCSIPFAGGDREETYFKLFEMGCDGFSTDYPSVMFSVIRKLKNANR